MIKLLSNESQNEELCKERVDLFNKITSRFWDYLYLSRHCGLDRGEDVILFLRENEITYFAPIVVWRDSLFHAPFEISDEYAAYMFDQFQSIRGVYHELLVHSIRVLLDRCAKLLSLKYNDINYDDGFGTYNKDKKQCKGLIKYAKEHEEEGFFKWVISEYDEWIKNINQFDNGIKHNYSSDSIHWSNFIDKGDDTFIVKTDSGRRFAYNRNHKIYAELVDDDLEKLVYSSYDFFDSSIKHLIT